MNDQTKAYMSTITIVACLLLLGVLAHLKVEGVPVAAVAVVTTVIAWMTRPPDKTDPPGGAKLVPILAIGGIVSSLFIGCTPGQREGARSALDVVQAACIIANAALPESKVAEVCGVTEPFMGPLRSLLASSRAAAATRMNAGAAPVEARAPVVCASTNNGVECWESPAR